MPRLPWGKHCSSQQIPNSYFYYKSGSSKEGCLLEINAPFSKPGSSHFQNKEIKKNLKRNGPIFFGTNLGFMNIYTPLSACFEL